MNTIRNDADIIIKEAIEAVLPDAAVRLALKEHSFPEGRLFIVSVGKAAWLMCKAATDVLAGRFTKGIVVTKYEHVKYELPNIACYEAGHPVPDDNSYRATAAVIEMISNFKAEDNVLFLVSGGGSALFEKPLINPAELQDITSKLLACGADIVEINTIRKRLSAVKGGRFAKLCEPARIFSVVLSDIIGDPLDMIASGPAYPDSSTSEDAFQIIRKYNLQLSADAEKCLRSETPKKLDNVETVITGSVRMLCKAAAATCERLGYETTILTDTLSTEASAAGKWLADIAYNNQDTDKSIAFIAGGETVVHLKGNGMGGRNQELALSAAEVLENTENTAIFSIGSDGTDGPTDAAGGYVDSTTLKKCKEKGLDVNEYLSNNDAYNALKLVDGLIMTGPTGTNVNDVAVVLIKR